MVIRTELVPVVAVCGAVDVNDEGEPGSSNAEADGATVIQTEALDID
jgi:hypothetical protein